MHRKLVVAYRPYVVEDTGLVLEDEGLRPTLIAAEEALHEGFAVVGADHSLRPLHPYNHEL